MKKIIFLALSIHSISNGYSYNIIKDVNNSTTNSLSNFNDERKRKNKRQNRIKF